MAIDSQPDDFLAPSEATQVVNIETENLDNDAALAVDNNPLANDCMCMVINKHTQYWYLTRFDLQMRQ